DSPRLLRDPCGSTLLTLPLSHEGPEERRRPPDGLDGRVTVTAELDVEAAPVADFPQGPEGRREVHRPLAEHQVLVDPADHVLDVDVGDPGAPGADVVGDRTLFDAMDVPEVDRQVEEGVIDALVESGVPREGVDEHPRLGLEREADRPRL